MTFLSSHPILNCYLFINNIIFFILCRIMFENIHAQLSNNYFSLHEHKFIFIAPIHRNISNWMLILIRLNSICNRMCPYIIIIFILSRTLLNKCYNIITNARSFIYVLKYMLIIYITICSFNL